MINSYDNFESFIQDKYTLIPAAIILGISAVLFFFGMLGCCSTIRESKAGLTVVRLCVFAFLFTFKTQAKWPTVAFAFLRLQFFMVIVVIFAAEVSALVFGFFYHSKVGSPVARRSPLTCGLRR